MSVKFMVFLVLFGSIIFPAIGYYMDYRFSQKRKARAKNPS